MGEPSASISSLERLSTQVMNLKDGNDARTELAMAYKRGFKDARHAAAELIAELIAEVVR